MHDSERVYYVTDGTVAELAEDTGAHVTSASHPISLRGG
jgi:hypothetical protein